MNGLGAALIAEKRKVLVLDGWKMAPQLADALSSFLRYISADAFSSNELVSMIFRLHCPKGAPLADWVGPLRLVEG